MKGSTSKFLLNHFWNTKEKLIFFHFHVINVLQSSRKLDLAKFKFLEYYTFETDVFHVCSSYLRITLLPRKLHVSSQTGKRHVFSKLRFLNCLFWLSGKKEWDNLTSLMKLRDINFAAWNEMKSYDGPFLSRDFLEYIKNFTTVFFIFLLLFPILYLRKLAVIHSIISFFACMESLFFQILSYVCP